MHSVALVLNHMTCAVINGSSDDCEEADRKVKMLITTHAKFNDDLNSMQSNNKERNEDRELSCY